MRIQSLLALACVGFAAASISECTQEDVSVYCPDNHFCCAAASGNEGTCTPVYQGSKRTKLTNQSILMMLLLKRPFLRNAPDTTEATRVTRSTRWFRKQRNSSLHTRNHWPSLLVSSQSTSSTLDASLPLLSWLPRRQLHALAPARTTWSPHLLKRSSTLYGTLPLLLNTSPSSRRLLATWFD